MPASPEKVRAAVDQLAAQLPAVQANVAGMPAVALAAVMPFLPALVATVQAAIPSEPDALDALLDAAAARVLELKSDAPAIDSTAEPEPGAAARAATGRMHRPDDGHGTPGTEPIG